MSTDLPPQSAHDNSNNTPTTEHGMPTPTSPPPPSRSQPSSTITTPTTPTGPSFTKPQPRPPKAPAHAAQVRIQNRRREWLARHGEEYVRRLDHELADPVRYDRLIRRFQSPAQREAEGRQKGFGRVLEVDLLRGEARMAKLGEGIASGDADAVADDTSDGVNAVGAGRAGGVGVCSSRNGGNDELDDAPDVVDAEDDGERVVLPAPQQERGEVRRNEHRNENGNGEPRTAEEGRARWEAFLRRRFVAGGDDDFDYRTVDEDDEFDALERRDQEEAWFDNEEPEWVENEEGDRVDEGEKGDERIGVKGPGERTLTGETGVQDF